MLRLVARVRTEDLEERITAVISIGGLGTTLAVTSNRSTLRRNNISTSTSVISAICIYS
jgi:hypothetical protein